MIIESVTNPSWADSEHTLIVCTVKFAHLREPVQFVASPDDVEVHGGKIFIDLVTGVYGEIGEYVAPPPPPPVTKESLMRELAMLAARIEALDSGTGAADTQPEVTGAETL